MTSNFFFNLDSWNPQVSAYVPYNKEWIKNRLLIQLKKMAQTGKH
jgi:hypothetical protein